MQDNKTNMNKYLVITESESGDDYVYFIQSKKEITEDLNNDIIDWLNEEGNDPGYEDITRISKITNESFKTI